MPEKPIGTIIDPAASFPKLATIPTKEQLAGFPPPKPIGVAGDAPSDNQLSDDKLLDLYEPVPLGELIPGKPHYKAGDTLSGLGMYARPDTSDVKVVPDVLPAPTVESVPEFDSLPQRTRDEIAQGWEVRHPGEKFDPKTWGVSVAKPLPVAPAGPPGVVLGARTEASRPPLSQRTLDEMNAGRIKVQTRNAETRTAIDAQTKSRVAELEAGGPPSPENMSYNEGR